MPFITCTYVIHPANPNKTSIIGHSNDPKNFIADEVVALLRNLKDRDLRKCNVILDVTNKSIVKCRSFLIDGKLADDYSYDRLLDYFKFQYPTQISALLESVTGPTTVDIKE